MRTRVRWKRGEFEDCCAWQLKVSGEEFGAEFQ